MDTIANRPRCEGWTVAIVPFPALGDLTLYLRLAQTWAYYGAQVSYFSDQLYPAAARFDWLDVQPLAEHSPESLARAYDLVIWDAGVGQPGACECIPGNIGFVSSKRLPDWMRGRTECLEVKGQVLGCRFAVFCENSDAGRHMVAWADHFLQKTFGLTAPNVAPVVKGLSLLRAPLRKAAIFPTTPNPKKNYSTRGFQRIAHALLRRGWQVSIVGTPREQTGLMQAYPGLEVLSFPSLDSLIGFLPGCAIVISNDSGGGHLASMLGLDTVTITRKPKTFTWRPGFNERNTVLSPLLTFKLGKGHIWRPFIPWWQVVGLAERAYALQSAKYENGS